MLIRLFNAFTKITGWLPQKMVFRTRILYADRKLQSRRIKGAAILVSNHTSVWDYAAWLFVFPYRTLRFQMAELLFKKQPLGLFLKCMGGICVDRNAHDFSFIARSKAVLDKGGVVGIFPEGRLPLKGEERPLEFKPGAAWLALESGAPIVPVYTDGAYFSKKRANVIIGTPIYAAELIDSSLSEKENIARVSSELRRHIIELEKTLYEKARQ